MARRTIYVGGLAELEALAQQYAGRLVAHDSGGYVFGRYCEITPEAGLLWADLHLCCRKARLTAKQRYAYTEHIKLVPHAEIARKMGCTPASVFSHVEAACAKLDALGIKGLGCFTSIVENCGGWFGIRHYVSELLD
jgi:hypothetical protein